MADGRGKEQATSSSLPPPTVRQLTLFGLPSLPHSFISLPLNSIIPAFYAANTTVTFAEMAVVMTASRIFDAITDPLIGYLSDRTKSPIGRRKPWILAGVILCAVSIYFLFRPARTAGVAYFGIWSFLIYFGFTLFEIPRGAWSSELSRDYHQRSRIQTYVGMFNIAGSFIFFAVPLLLFVTGVTTTTAITDTSLTGIALLYALLMPVAMILAIIFVPSGIELTAAPSTIRQLMTSLRKNKPLWHYFGIISAWGLGQGGYFSVSFIFLTYYMHLGSVYPYLMILFFFVALVALPTWAPLTRRIGKHRTWALAMSLDVLTRPLLLLLTPGPGAAIPVLMLGALSAFLSAPCNIAPPSVLGDVIDYDILKTRANKAGNFFALNTLFIKAAIALGGGAGFLLLSVFGYSVKHANGSTANLGLLIANFVWPAVWFLVASTIAWNFPITNARHNVIRRRIEGRVAIKATPAE
jgi:Na+/melibiose symporter-like transporter